MAFIPYTYDHGQPLPSEYVKASAGDYKVGMCLALTNGRAAKSQKPEYVAVCDVPGAADDTLIPVMRIHEDTMFESQLAAAGTGLGPGSLVDVAADCMNVGTSTANKNLEIISMEGTEKGSVCRVRFVG